MHNPKQRDTKSNVPIDAEETDDDESEPITKQSIKKYLIGLARDILIAIIIMVIIIGSLWGYTGNWPPMVVIESSSMMHGDDSSVGTIDTGDLVLVKTISGRNDVKTYVQGEKSGYKTFGTYGDVIIFKKNGVSETPVIHRAVVWLEYNESGHYMKDGQMQEGSFDVPHMGLYDVSIIHIQGYKPMPNNLTIDLVTILSNFKQFGRTPHSGFITKGDNNEKVDQTSNLADAKGRPVEPIKPNWIVGKAEGELPWFGLIKLFIGGETNEAEKRPPPTSVRMLILSIALIIIIPIALDFTFSRLGKDKKKKDDGDEDKHGQELRDYSPRDVSKFKSKNISYTPGPFKRDSKPGTDEARDDELNSSDKYESLKRTKQKTNKTQPETGEDSEFISKDDLLKKIK